MQMQIRRLLFLETGTYNDMMLRPYQTSLHQKDILQLQEATRGGQNLSASNLAGLAGQIVRPATNPTGTAQIANGWRQGRFAFMLEVFIPDNFGGARVQYLTGYTDHAEISHGGHLDPNMQLFFNNSIQCRQVMYQSPGGNVLQQRVNDASHVLVGSYAPSIGSVQNTTHTMRPADVFDAVGASTLAQFGDVVDVRTTFAQGTLKKSLRENASAPTYLSRLLTTHRDVMAGANEDVDTLPNLMGEAAGSVKEPTVLGDAFLNYLQVETSLVTGGSVTYGALCRVQPNLDQIADVVLARGPHLVQGPHQAGQSEHWQGTTHETIMSTILSHAVPALMMELMVTKVAFRATNRTLNGQVEVMFAEVKSFAENLDMSPYLQAFDNRLRSQVLADLSHGGMIDYDISCRFDVLGETRIEIAVAGNPPVYYVVPSFADALFVPVLTNQYQNLQVLAGDISTLTDNISVNHSAHATFGGHSPFSTEYNNGTTGAL